MSNSTFRTPDLHMHTVFSDGTDTPRGIIAAVRDAGIDLFSVTDHDSCESGGIIDSALEHGDPAFINGIEFSCRTTDGKYHILGYGCDTADSPVRAAAEHAHQMRLQKTKARLEYLKDKYGFEFSGDETERLFANNNPGKPHIARMMMSHGYVRSVAQAFSLMSGVRCGGRYLTPREAIEAILGSGGIPVLAHGILGDGGQRLTEEEIGTRVKTLKECGLKGLECFYSGFSKADSEYMLSLALKNELLVTAGSDYHGANKNVSLAQTGLTDASPLERFYKTALEAGMIIQK